MIASIKISIQDLTTTFIEELKQKYGSANLEISIVPTIEQQLSEEEFWEVIAQFNWTKNNSADIIQSAVDRLADLSVVQIYDFEDKLTDKLRTLDQRSIAEQVGYRTETYFSVDTFLYARACVIANGKDAYEEVLNDPTTMPQDLTFEPLLSLASLAYKQKTGKEFSYFPTISYETFANENGWN